MLALPSRPAVWGVLHYRNDVRMLNGMTTGALKVLIQMVFTYLALCHQTGCIVEDELRLTNCPNGCVGLPRRVHLGGCGTYLKCTLVAFIIASSCIVATYSVVNYVVDEGAFSHIRCSNNGNVKRSLLLRVVIVIAVGRLCWRRRWCCLHFISICQCSGWQMTHIYWN